MSMSSRSFNYLTAFRILLDGIVSNSVSNYFDIPSLKQDALNGVELQHGHFVLAVLETSVQHQTNIIQCLLKPNVSAVLNFITKS